MMNIRHSAVALATAASFFLVVGQGEALADCAAFGGTLKANGNGSITSLLKPGGGVYACYRSGSAIENNETLINGTQVQDYKKGPSDPRDRSTVVGTYRITGGNTGVITYTYGSNGFAYNICATPNGNTYQFAPTGGGPNIAIIVSNSPSCTAGGSLGGQ